MPDRPGTSDEAWQAWSGWTDLLPLPEPTGEVVVVSAHPDDQILGIGGLLHRLSELGTSVRFVIVTDGEGSHPGSPTCSLTQRAGDAPGACARAADAIVAAASPTYEKRLTAVVLVNTFS